MNKKIFLLTAFLSLSTSGCLPAIIGTAATAGIVTAGQDRQTKEIKDDIKIWTSIKDQFIQYNSKDLFKNVSVKVVEGRVLLAGNVEKMSTKLLSEKIAWNPAGVTEVINEIEVKRYPASEAAKDGLLTTKVKARLALERDIKSNNYKIQTINGVVYVLGTTRSQQELSMAIDLISRISGVRKVVSYVTIRE